MRIRNARIKGFGRFNDVAVDFDALPYDALLVALCGENGEGKSTLVDLLVDGACWREWPRRAGAKLDHVATGRDSLLEVETEISGRTYRLKHLVDGVSGKGESAVYCGEEALTKSGKLTEFYSWAKENLPAKSVVHSSIVSHPAYGSFVTMRATERKDVVLLALGVEGIEKHAADARKRVDAAELEVTRLRRELAAAEAGADVDAATEALSAAEHSAHTAHWLVSEAQAALDVARQLAGDSALARLRYDEQRAAWDDLARRTNAAKRALSEALEKLYAADIDAAKAASEGADLAHEKAKDALARAESAVSLLRIRRDAAQRQSDDRHRVQLELDRAVAAKADVAKRIANNRGLLAKAEEIRGVIEDRARAASELPSLEAAEAEAQQKLDAAHEALRALGEERHAGAEARIALLREGLTAIAADDCAATASELAGSTLRRDDRSVEIARTFPARKRAIEGDCSRATGALESAKRTKADCLRRLTATHPHEAALAQADARIAELEPQLTKATADVERLTEELEALPEPERVPADPDVAGLRRVADRFAAAALEAAQRVAAVLATRAQLEEQIERLRVEISALSAQLSSTPEPVAPEAAPDLASLETELAGAKAKADAASQEVGRAHARLEAAQAASAKATALRDELEAAQVELADWTSLAHDLGRKGLQAALVDSAGPELTRATNDLLHSCFGTRWTVTFETQRVKDSGGVAEGYDIRIIDTERGRDGVVEDLSDGERTIIGEAVSLALSELACKRAGFERPTLIRDESGAALSAERRPMWVAMLRRAAKHVNADRVILISHSEDVQELCDARIRVADGKLTVEA